MSRYNIAVAEVPARHAPIPAPSLYESYKELLEIGTAQRGSLMPSRLWRAGVLGDLNVFRGAPAASSKIRASAILLWDWSGSQDNFRPVLLSGLTSIAQALVQLRFRVWAAAYTGSGAISLEDGTAVPAGDFQYGSPALLGQCRYGVAVGVVKHWADAFDGRRIATLADLPGGGTPTGPVLQYVRKRVLPFTGDGRKTLLVLATDGRADDGSYQMREIAHLSGIRDLTLVTIYCGPKKPVFASMQEEFPHCFWAPDRANIPAAFAHTLRALRGGL